MSKNSKNKKSYPIDPIVVPLVRRNPYEKCREDIEAMQQSQKQSGEAEPSSEGRLMSNQHQQTCGQTSMKSTDCKVIVPTMTSSGHSTCTRTTNCSWSLTRNWLQCLFLLAALTILAYQQVLLSEMSTNSQKIAKEMSVLMAEKEELLNELSETHGRLRGTQVANTTMLKECSMDHCQLPCLLGKAQHLSGFVGKISTFRSMLNMIPALPGALGKLVNLLQGVVSTVEGTPLLTESVRKCLQVVEGARRTGNYLELEEVKGGVPKPLEHQRSGRSVWPVMTHIWKDTKKN